MAIYKLQLSFCTCLQERRQKPHSYSPNWVCALGYIIPQKKRIVHYSPAKV